VAYAHFTVTHSLSVCRYSNNYSHGMVGRFLGVYDISEVDTLHVGTVLWEADATTKTLKHLAEGPARAALKTPMMKEPCLTAYFSFIARDVNRLHILSFYLGRNCSNRSKDVQQHQL